MKKNGFTLIELLAVIVILAIIAVITVPKVAEMIESSRKGAAEDAFYGTIKAAELGWTRELQNNSSLGEIVCKVEGDSFKCYSGYTTNDSGVKVSSSGTMPDAGWIIISADGAASVVNQKIGDDIKYLVFNGYKCYGDSTKATCERL